MVAEMYGDELSPIYRTREPQQVGRVGILAET